MREKHGWVKLASDSILLGLDSYQFHFYHLARALATPPHAKEKAGLFDLPDRNTATLMKCSRETVYRLKKELLGMGLMHQKGGKWYVNEPDMDALHNHSIALQEITRFLREHQGIAASLNPTPRRNGHRRSVAPVDINVAPVDINVAPVGTPDGANVAPVDINVAPVGTHVAPVGTPRIYSDSGRSIEDKKGTDSASADAARKHQPHPDPRVTTTLREIENLWGKPIMHWSKEAKEIKAALARGYLPEQIIACWKASQRSPKWREQWVPLAYLVEDLGEFVTTGRVAKWYPRGQGQADSAWPNRKSTPGSLPSRGPPVTTPPVTWAELGRSPTDEELGLTPGWEVRLGTVGGNSESRAAGEPIGP